MGCVKPHSCLSRSAKFQTTAREPGLGPGLPKTLEAISAALEVLTADPMKDAEANVSGLPFATTDFM
jgi:hypothetical protein